MQPGASNFVTQVVTPCRTSAPFRCAFTTRKQPRPAFGTAAVAPGVRVCTCYTQSRAEQAESAGSPPDAESQFARERASLRSFADNLRGEQSGSNGSRPDAKGGQAGPIQERAFLVGVAQKGKRDRFAYNVHESLEELGRLAETAGLEVRLSPCLPHMLLQLTHHASAVGIKALPSQLPIESSAADSFCSVSDSTITAALLHPMAVEGPPSCCPQVVGQTFQNLENVSPRTYIGSGKTFEVEGAVDELEADTVIFDDELTPGMGFH